MKKTANTATFEEFIPKKSAIKIDDKDKTVEKVEDDESVIETLSKELSAF